MPASRLSLFLSVAIHVLIATLLFTVVRLADFRIKQMRHLAAPNLEPQIRFKLITPVEPGGGGGGENALLPASRGRLPRPSPKPFVPPSVEMRQARMLVEPALQIPDIDLPAVDLTRYGDPLSTSLVLSGGPGKDGGIGGGDRGGVGSRSGPGYGDREGGVGFSGLTAGLIPPVVIYQVHPDFSEEARKAKYQGTVLVTVEVDSTGKPRNARVVQSVGMGLDERAVEAVLQWRFKPGRLNGRPVAVPARIEVNFRLL